MALNEENHCFEEISTPRWLDIKVSTGGRLPHWDAENAHYFVTYRLADSIPDQLMGRLIASRNKLLSQARIEHHSINDILKGKISNIVHKRVEKTLDIGYGECILKEPDIANVVVESLMKFDGQRYRMISWCIMPNHVHSVFKILPGNELSRIMHTWKSYQAQVINIMLGRSGQLWQREYFDRMIRDQDHFINAVEYVKRNPVKAGLGEWEWVWERNGTG